MSGPRPTLSPPPGSRPRRKLPVTRGWELVGNGLGDDPAVMAPLREPPGNPSRANRRMNLPLLASLSANSSTPVPDDEWVDLVEAALASDPAAVRRLFAAAARWANQLIHQRSWLLDPEAEVVSLMWHTLHARPRSSDEWRYLVVRRLRRSEYRPNPEVPSPPDLIESAVPTNEFESRTVDQLAARTTIRDLGAMPPAMDPYLAAVWMDRQPSSASAHVASQYRYLRRRRAVA